MTLDELITQLEVAQELSSDGEWKADKRIIDVWDGDKIIDSPVEAPVCDAKAIAIRHNTAALTLACLRGIKQTEAMSKIAHAAIDEASICPICNSKNVKSECIDCGEDWGY